MKFKFNEKQIELLQDYMDREFEDDKELDLSQDYIGLSFSDQISRNGVLCEVQVGLFDSDKGIGLDFRSLINGEIFENLSINSNEELECILEGLDSEGIISEAMSYITDSYYDEETKKSIDPSDMKVYYLSENQKFTLDKTMMEEYGHKSERVDNEISLKFLEAYDNDEDVSEINLIMKFGEMNKQFGINVRIQCLADDKIEHEEIYTTEEELENALEGLDFYSMMSTTDNKYNNEY